jgi:hypothetical protein
LTAATNAFQMSKDVAAFVSPIIAVPQYPAFCYSLPPLNAPKH